MLGHTTHIPRVLIELIHFTIRNSFVCDILEYNNFNLECSLKKLIRNYNNAIHRVTKYCPKEIFFNIDYKMFENVYNK